jgi:2-polyprenyl-6-methoxyphenol hydroxylase-like FAD-dependent oxidoreductase
VPAHCRFIALMPQWDFLDFLARQATCYPNFRLFMEVEATDLLIGDGRVTGVAVRMPSGAFAIHANLVVGADGRHSIIREKAALPLDEFGVPIDVLWMRLDKRPEDSTATFGRIAAGAIFVSFDRGDYWQCALVIPKGAAEKLRASGLESFRNLIVRIAPDFKDRVAELQDWDQIKLLTVKIDRLREWCREGLLCIGDCAHAMSPIGGVGINLAVQDAVAAANILVPSFKSGEVTLETLRRVQKRREFPTRLTQSLQMLIQNNVMTRVLKLEREPKPPSFIKLLNASALLRRIPARLVGIGFRPEHVHTTPAVPPAIPDIAAM